MTPPATQRLTAGALAAPAHYPALPGRDARPRYGSPVAPRRVSGPVRHPRARAARRRSAHPLDRPLLDQLIRGRLWIALVAIGLLGIVALRVAILSVGSGVGDTVAKITQLEQNNQQLAGRIATLEGGGGVASEVEVLGMVPAPADNVVYLHWAGGDAAAAASLIVQPYSSLTQNTTTSSVSLSNAAASSSSVTATAPVATTTPSSGQSATTTQPAATSTNSTPTTPTKPASTPTGAAPSSGGASVAPSGGSTPGGSGGAGGGTSPGTAG